MRLRKFILAPFSLIFLAITKVRNFLYDKSIFKSYSFPFPIICLGNLKVGGTGKTPHVEYIVNVLKENYKVGILSRGYGRKTKGFFKATLTSQATEIGDEPAQYVRKFSPTVSVAVSEDRVKGVENLLKTADLDILLLDDAFQHRRLKPGKSILLTEFGYPFYKDNLLPGGWLRESRKGAARADAILVTKCPDNISESQFSSITADINSYSGAKPVYFTRYSYKSPVPLFDAELPEKVDNVIAISGIANPSPFYNYLEKHYKLEKTFTFADHYNYTKDDEANVLKAFKNIKSGTNIVLTTEKDAVKLKDLNIFRNAPVFYVPIEVEFLDKEEEFRQMILEFVKK